MRLQHFGIFGRDSGVSQTPAYNGKDGANAGPADASRFDGYSRPAVLMSAQWSSDEPNWLMTLSDLTLLLLCFLALWYVRERKQPETTPAPTPAVIVSAPPAVAVLPPPVETPTTQQWNAPRAEMEALIAERGLGPAVRLEVASRDFVISIQDMVSFATGKAELSAQALPVLEKVSALVLSRPGLAVEVSGHTDSRRIATAQFPSNWELSAARASRVARYLIEKGVDPSRIAVQGYASQRPRVPQSDLDRRRANRRVEIRLYQPADTKIAAPD
jgi:chemotaxis protein MotB